MYNANLLKSGNVLKTDETRVIDSNTKVAERLKHLAEILEDTTEEDFFDDFSAGLDAVQVEQLLGDPEMAMPEEGAPQIDTQAFEQMRVEAEAEAEGILTAAREEAESIIAAAQAEAEAIKSKAMTDGHEEGYQVGYEEGVSIAKEAEEKCAQREQELETYYGRKIDELEPLFVDKITDIYEHVFMIELSDKKELVHYLLTDAMRNIEGGKTFLVHVSKDDYEYVSARKDELMQGLPGTSTLEVIEDMTLSQSQCFIEADSGIFDCGLGTELALLKKELTLLSFRTETGR
ncbi:MAG: FliH/SctL family protein [Lachnospiraceae bacterium]|nr:FliH/SctL family protein [Lachnospiraceae bacterium]